MAGSVVALPDNWTFMKRKPNLEVEATFIIGDFEKEMNIRKTKEMLESRIFILNETPFKIRVFPSGDVEESKNHVSVFLGNESNNDVSVAAEFEICNSKKLRFKNTTVRAKGDWGYTKCMEKEAVTEVLVDGAFIVKVKVEMEHKNYVVIGEAERNGESKTAAEIVTIHTSNIFENMINTDFILTCEGEQIPCHRHFLISASPVFARMMESGMKEREEGKTDVKCSFTVGKELVRFIYTGNVQEDILMEHVVEILELGERLGMETLKMCAEDKMMKILDIENMIRFFVAGDYYRAKRIREKAKSLLKINLRAMKANPDWENEFGAKKELIMELVEDII